MAVALTLEKKSSLDFEVLRTSKTIIKRSLRILREFLLLDPLQGLYDAYRLPVRSRLDESLSGELLSLGSRRKNFGDRPMSNESLSAWQGGSF